MDPTLVPGRRTGLTEPVLTAWLGQRHQPMLGGDGRAGCEDGLVNAVSGVVSYSVQGM